MSSEAKPGAPVIYSHTGLRGIAAMSVFLAHIADPDVTNWNLDQRFFEFFRWSGYAVDLFFILSWLHSELGLSL